MKIKIDYNKNKSSSFQNRDIDEIPCKRENSIGRPLELKLHEFYIKGTEEKRCYIQ
jgi:hypothetical protein